MRNQIANLVYGYTISAGGADRIILRSENSGPVLHIIVRMVEQIECLRLNGNAVPLREVKRSRDSQVNLIDPRSIK